MDSYRPKFSRGQLTARHALGMLLLVSAHAAEPARVLGNVDGRTGAGDRLPPAPSDGGAALAARRQAITRNLADGFAQLRAAAPGAEVTTSPETGGIEVVSAPAPLTPAAAGRAGVEIVQDFLRAHAALYGLADADFAQLHFLGESGSAASGLRVVRVEQSVNGCPVFQSETRFILDRDGRLVRSVGLLVPDASAGAAPLANLRSAQAALAAALTSLNLAADPGDMTLSKTEPDGHRVEISVHHPQVTGTVPSELVYFPLTPGVLVPAWSQTITTAGDLGDWSTLVDARTGTLLWRKNLRAESAAPTRPEPR